MNSQNIYDNEKFFDEYKALRERKDNHNELLEQPTIKKLLPDFTGKTVLDLGCGYGWNCIDFINRGADRVVGIDISKKMLEIARKDASHEKIKYINMSMTDISNLNEKFDFIYSSLAIHYVEDFESLAKDMYEILNVDGYLLFSQEHPLTTATIDDKGHFNKNLKGKYISYTFSNYNEPGVRKSNWFVGGVVKYHRTFSDIINTLTKAGFAIEHIVEPTPDDRAINFNPKMRKEFIKPTFLIIRARKV